MFFKMRAQNDQEEGSGQDFYSYKPEHFPQLTLDQLDAETRPLGEDIVKTWTAGLLGPYNVMLRSPVMRKHLKGLMDYFRFESTLPPRLKEFAILIQAQLRASDVQWFSHYPAALKAGPAHSVVDDLKENIRPRNMRPEERAVYDVCVGMSTKKEISDELFHYARTMLGEK